MKWVLIALIVIPGTIADVLNTRLQQDGIGTLHAEPATTINSQGPSNPEEFSNL